MSPLFSASALLPPVFVVVGWSFLARSGGEGLGYAAPVVVAASFVLAAILCLGGGAAAVFGLVRGERPRLVGLVALVANLSALLWVFGPALG